MISSNVINIRKRLLILLIIISVLIILLVVRVGYWSLFQSDWLQAQATSQWIKDEKVFAKRGTIMDRGFNVLAQSAVVDTVVIRPQRIKDEKVNKVTDELARVLEMPREEVYKKVSTKTRTENGEEKEIVETWLKRQITTEQAEELKNLKLPGVAFVSDSKRFYPNKDFASQLIGYTSMDGVGQTGIEKRYNRILEGRHGRKVAETAKNGYGIPNGQEMIINPQDGYNVVLTIDEILQSFLETECKNLYGTQELASVQGIVMDIQTGEILAMCSIPEFDLNDIPRQDAELMAVANTNRVVAVPYNYGNIANVIVGAMALNEGIITEEGIYKCEGFYNADSHKISCGDVHGDISLKDAILNGCVSYSAMQSVQLTKEKFFEYLRGMSLNASPGLNLLGESAGNIPEIKYIQNPQLAKIASGENLGVTQLQLATALGGILNKGMLNTPKIVSAVVDESKNIIEKAPNTEQRQILNEGVSQTINGILTQYVANAEGEISAIDGYSTGGIYSVAPHFADKIAVEGKELVTYATYGPSTTPKYLVIITADGITKGEGSHLATAPYAKKVLEETLRYSNVPPDNKDKERQEKIIVPDVVGLTLEDATAKFAEVNLQFKADGTGTVVSQIPVANEEVYPSAKVVIAMDTKTPVQDTDLEMTQVPDVVGMDIISARMEIYKAGLKYNCVGSGTVKTQFPAAGTTIQKDSTITIELEYKLN